MERVEIGLSDVAAEGLLKVLLEIVFANGVADRKVARFDAVRTELTPEPAVSEFRRRCEDLSRDDSGERVARIKMTFRSKPSLWARSSPWSVTIIGPALSGSCRRKSEACFSPCVRCRREISALA